MAVKCAQGGDFWKKEAKELLLGLEVLAQLYRVVMWVESFPSPAHPTLLGIILWEEIMVYILCISGPYVFEKISKWNWQLGIEVHGGHWFSVLLFFFVEIFYFY